MISRDTSEPRMPSWPIEMPSETAIVTNSNGKPPASRTPTFARLARRSSGMLHGVTSFHDDATPTCALPEVGVGHADRTQHRPGGGARVAVGDLVATRSVLLFVGHRARLATRAIRRSRRFARRATTGREDVPVQPLGSVSDVLALLAHGSEVRDEPDARRPRARAAVRGDPARRASRRSRARGRRPRARHRRHRVPRRPHRSRPARRRARGAAASARGSRASSARTWWRSATS